MKMAEVHGNRNHVAFSNILICKDNCINLVNVGTEWVQAGKVYDCYATAGLNPSPVFS